MVLIKQWRKEYNQVRPHSALKYQPPAPEAILTLVTRLQVVSLLGAGQLDSARVHMVKGWFTDTIPISEVGAIALLHLDCDLYESVKFCLEHLYDNVIEGGYIVIDDYGYWSGCKAAVDEFIKYRNLKVELIRVDSQGVYFYKKYIDSSKPVKSTT